MHERTSFTALQGLTRSLRFVDETDAFWVIPLAVGVIGQWERNTLDELQFTAELLRHSVDIRFYGIPEQGNL